VHIWLVDVGLTSRASTWESGRVAMIALAAIYFACCCLVRISCIDPVYPGVANSFVETVALSATWAAVPALLTQDRRVQISTLAGMHTLKVPLRNLTDGAPLQLPGPEPFENLSSLGLPLNMHGAQEHLSERKGTSVVSSSFSELCGGGPLGGSVLGGLRAGLHAPVWEPRVRRRPPLGVSPGAVLLKAHDTIYSGRTTEWEHL